MVNKAFVARWPTTIHDHISETHDVCFFIREFDLYESLSSVRGIVYHSVLQSGWGEVSKSLIVKVDNN